MKKFTVTRNLFEGDNYKCFQEFETEALFLEWAATKKHLGRKDSWAQASTDMDGDEVLPSDLVDPQQSRVRTVNVDAYVGQDQDGNDVNYEAYSYDVTEYLQEDQWSYTVEDITDQLADEALVATFESDVSAEEAYACEMVMKRVTQINKNKAYDAATKDAMMADSELATILQMLMVAKRPSKAKSLVSAYASTTYYTAEEKQSIVDYLTAKGF